MATVPELATAIDGVQDAAKRVIVDLSESTFLDSAAINSLIRHQRQLESAELPSESSARSTASFARRSRSRT